MRRLGSALLALALFSCGVGRGAASGTNRLARESSPYLLLHAHDPVDWYPWGEEAIARARREGKPIFLSVGYSTCYWCHVMQREVFANRAIAALLNRWFVNVKVDREERPEIDEIYLAASELLAAGGGGWPNSVFLTPDLEPFFAGSYFPPADRDGQPGFPTVLRRIADAWEHRRAEVEASARLTAAAVREAVAARRAPAATVPPPALAEATAASLAGRYDATWGGFDGPPKFPSPGNLFFLWENGGEPERRMVLDTLRRMGEGAIYDQVGGGFHRYALDARWRVPHFEKMLYDNALLADLLAGAWQAERDPDLERLGRGTLDFLLARMAAPQGGFAAAIDAETGGEEGGYYLWTAAELRAALGDDGFRFLAPLLGCDGPPNVKGGKYALYLAHPLAEQAARLGLDRRALAAKMEPQLAKLRRARARRRPPRVDDKVLADWNGMAIAALARGGRAFGEPRYLQAAERAAGFVLGHLRGADGTLRHAWRGGQAKAPAYLDDYAYLVRGLLALDAAGAAGGPRWRAEAVRLAEEMERRLRDPQGGYYLSAAGSDLLFRPKTVADAAIPSGNAVAVLDLLDLAARTGEAAPRERAAAALRAFAPEFTRYPSALPTLALALLRFHGEQAPAVAALPAAGAAGPAGETGGRGPDSLGRAVVVADLLPAGKAGADGWRPIEVRLGIRAGWHVNANPASLDFLIPTKVEGEVRKLVYPPGEVFHSAFAAELLRVYSGTVAIRAEAAAQAGAVRLTYQACDDRRCLPPVTRELAVPPRSD
jgi:uncharacterized protein